MAGLENFNFIEKIILITPCATRHTVDPVPLIRQWHAPCNFAT